MGEFFVLGISGWSGEEKWVEVYGGIEVFGYGWPEFLVA